MPNYKTKSEKRRNALKRKKLKKKCQLIRSKLRKVSEIASKFVTLKDKNAIFHQTTSGSHIKCNIEHPQINFDEDDALAIYFAIHDARRTSSKIVHITRFTIYDKEGRLHPLYSIHEGVKLYMSGYIKKSLHEQDDCIAVKDVGPLIAWSSSSQKTVVRSLKTQYRLSTPSEDYASVYKKDLKQNRNKKFVKKIIKTDNSKSVHSSNESKRIYQQLDDNIQQKGQTRAITTTLVRKSFENLFTHQLQFEHPCNLTFDRKKCGMCTNCQLPDCGECFACRSMPKFGGKGGKKKSCIEKKCLNVSSGEEHSDCDENNITNSHKQMNFKVPTEFNGFEHAKIIWPEEPSHIGDDNIFYKSANVNGIVVAEGDFVVLEPRYQNVPALIARVAYIWSVLNKPKVGYFHAEIFFRSQDTVLGELGYPREIFLSDTCCDEVPLPCILRKADVTFRNISSNWAEEGGEPMTEELCDDDGKTYYFQKFYERFTGRFEDICSESDISPKLLKIAKELNIYCFSCMQKDIRDGKIFPVLGEAVNYDPISSDKKRREVSIEPDRLEFSSVAWRGEILKKGKGVFLKAGTFRVHSDILSLDKPKISKQCKVDQNIYTENYRKTDQNLTGSNDTTAKPFDVGYIEVVCAKPLIGDMVIPPQQIYFKVRRLYRPGQTFCRFPQNEDLNVLFWSDEIYDIPASNVVGLCQLFYADNIPPNESPDDWVEKDPSKFYFSKAYNKKTKEMEDVPEHAMHIGLDQQNIKRTSSEKTTNVKDFSGKSVYRRNVDKESRPLRTLDLFAGAGGLAEGLRRAGVTDCLWAVEVNPAAAATYARNHERCRVFCEDANAILKSVLAGRTHSNTGLLLPTKGEVELICAGPPCQGFSMMNRFSSEECSKLKNCLIATLLSFIDYYRPKYFIFENVRNFAAFMKGMVLKAMLRVLVNMGYQCRFGVLQAGNFGVPQSRRRLIILAAAPGLKLPLYPEPSHAFNKRACSLDVMIDGKLFFTNSRWWQSAPFRTCTVYDALFDLPPIESGADEDKITYDWKPYTHFQRLMRQGSPARILDHVCNKVTPLSQARIERIPIEPGSDWRDLPNVSVQLSNGKYTKVLEYKYCVTKRKKSRRRDGSASVETLRKGVCPCAEGGLCTPAARQKNTLIPWNLVHTADKHNNWSGLYGRVEWYGYCSTTLTNPDPMHSQGRVLHPDQHRILSVRECARSQGFRDEYLFVGTVKEKYHQIGNAVPPPLAEALGREIKKALMKNS